LKTNYILIDFENIQPKNLELLKGGPFKIKVFIGHNQNKLPLEVALSLQPFGSDAEYIRIEGSGPNALDFHIAFYVGKLAAEDPNGYFHIISKDTGFDPLIKHLKSIKIFAQREKDIADIPLIKISNTNTTEEKIDAVVDNLIKRKATKPRTHKTLLGTLKSLFINKLSDNELSNLMDELVKRKLIIITEDKVNYNLPDLQIPTIPPAETDST
jgi:polyhydroxyalkanoate synthesis regulator phasin